MKPATMVTGSDIIPSVRLVDASYKAINPADSYFLVHISPGNLSYAVFDTVSNTIVAFCCKPVSANDYLNEAITILAEEEWATEKYAQTKVVVQPTEYVIIPQDLFDPRDIASYLRFHSYHEPGGSLLFDTIESLKIVGAYHLPHHALNSIDRILGDISVFATPSPFIQLAYREYKADKQDHLLAMFTQNHMHLIGINQGKFVFYNSFEIGAKDDVSYYALAVCEQLYLSPEKVAVHVWGNEAEYGERIETLSYYFRNVAHGKKPKALKYAEALDSLPDFAHYPLFAAAL